MMDVIYMGNTPAGRQDPEPARCLPRQAHVSRRTHQAKINLSRKLELERGHRVRALVHRQDDRSEALVAAGAEIVTGDLLNFHQVSSAMRGVSGAYFAYPIVPGLLDATVIFAQAAGEAGVTSAASMSQISARREAASDAARQHWLAERLLDRSPMLTAHLKPTFFAEWVISGLGREGDHGVLRLPFRTG